VTALDDGLSGITTLGLDSSVFIYFVERNPRYVDLVREVFRRIGARQFTGCSSVVTMTKVLVLPKRTGDSALEQAYRAMLLRSRNFRLLNTTREVAGTAADLRARYNLRTPDAIQLATALGAGCEAFLSNDLGLRRVAELRVLALDELTL
jgi:predicted nucleic acid-binding protein